MVPPPVDGERFFGLLATSLRIAVDRLHERLHDAGFDDLRPAHGFAFSLLSQGGATATDLAEHLGVTKQAAGQMVDFLEHSGYVKRQAHPHDRRGKLVLLTSRGHACIEFVVTTMDSIVNDWASEIGVERLETTTDVLAALVAQEDASMQRGLRPTW